MSVAFKGCLAASVLAAAAQGAQLSQLAAGGSSAARHLRLPTGGAATPGAAAAGAAEEEEPLVEPLRFKQQLLVCNAYPSASTLSVQKNGHRSLAGGDEAIGFRECRYLQGEVQKKDELGFLVQDVQGTFQVGDLPSSDAILLLVVEKRAGTTMVAFQSFAFPAASDRKEAQIAVINSIEGKGDPKLHMADHLDGKEAQAMVSKRVEQLSFNRVYSVDEGSYDASLDGGSSKVLTLSRSQNYVLLRTGGNGFAESLVAFPPEAPAKKTTLADWFKGLVRSSFVRVQHALHR